MCGWPGFRLMSVPLNSSLQERRIGFLPIPSLGRTYQWAPCTSRGPHRPSGVLPTPHTHAHTSVAACFTAQPCCGKHHSPLAAPGPASFSPGHAGQPVVPSAAHGGDKGHVLRTRENGLHYQAGSLENVYYHLYPSIPSLSPPARPPAVAVLGPSDDSSCITALG